MSIQASAIVLTGIYTGACNRKIGLILGVDAYRLKFLNLAGTEEIIPRHQIVQMAMYSMDELPDFQKNLDASLGQVIIHSVPAFRVYTLTGREEKVLLTGYPVDFTDEKIAFLSGAGGEILIDKKNIAKIERIEDFGIRNSESHRELPNFGQVYAFMKCPMDSGSVKLGSIIYPEQVLSEPLTIKREMDRLQHGFELVDHYLDEQVFYSEPLVYKNKTRIGIWESLGSRYGSSSSRSNNGTPILNNEYASDIYDYQRIISTGSQPNPLFVHEEAQTQVYFAFKASYFHFIGFADPNLLLVGKNYQYRLQDLTDGDVKSAMVSGVGFGFDRNGWQVGFLAASADLGANISGNLYADYIPITRLHLNYKNYLYGIELLAGSGTKSGFAINDQSEGNSDLVDYKNYRLNYYQWLNLNWKGIFSLINSSYTFQDYTNNRSLSAKSTSLSGVLEFAYSKRINIDSQFSVEQYKGSGAIASKTYLKAATSVHLFF